MKTFITFADSRMSDVLERIQRQATAIGFFDEVKTYTEMSLDSDFRHKYKNQLSKSVRGFGYWCWKSHLIQKELSRLPEGSHLYYCDAGCHINPRGIARLQEYDEILASSPTGIVAFEIDYLERQWTKGDIFSHFGIKERDDIVNSNQIQATIILIRKCKKAVDFVNEWVKTWEDNFSLIDDTPSQSPNFADFIENRHDQSIFSVLGKLYGITLLSYKEIEPPVDAVRNIEAWQKLKDSPILAMRDRYCTKAYLRKLKRYKILAQLPLGAISKKYKKKLEKAYSTNPGLMNPPPYLQ